jgi:magnesium-transporting ATPase (P-type)
MPMNEEPKNEEPNVAEEQDRREFRKIFAETGHRTLNAFLIVSSGAALSFLTFVGALFKEWPSPDGIPPELTHAFAFTIQSFVVAVVSCMLMHGTSFFSHGAYHLRHNRAGFTLTIITVFLGLVCLIAFVVGSVNAIVALQIAANTLAG